MFDLKQLLSYRIYAKDFWKTTEVKATLTRKRDSDLTSVTTYEHIFEMKGTYNQNHTSGAETNNLHVST
jgi:hypothetical protein